MSPWYRHLIRGCAPAKAPAVPQRRPLAQAMWALEPRYMFDAAGIATGAEAAASAVAQAQADGAVASPGSDSTVDEALVDAVVNTSEPGTRREVAFIDPAVRDADTLIDGLPDHVQVVHLDAASDGVDQIAQALRDHSDVDAVHIFSHASDGRLRLGNATVSTASLAGAQHAGDFAAIGAALADDADIVFYGCNFAAQESGRSAVERIAALTGADVAASSNDTGAAALGGDWTMELNVGAIEAPIVVSEQARARYLDVLADGDPGRQLTPVLWLTADQGITEAGGAVSAWADRSGNGNDLTQTDANLQPTLLDASRASNFHPTLDFDGDRLDQLLGSLGIDGNRGSVFVAANSDVDTGTTVLWSLRSSNGAIAQASPVLSYSNAVSSPNFRAQLDYPGTTVSANNGDIEVDAGFVSTFEWGSSSSSTSWLRTDASQFQVFQAPNTSSRPVQDRLSLGGDLFAGNGTWDGQIHEVIVYDRGTDDTQPDPDLEREFVLNYLAIKYGGGLTLGTGQTTVRLWDGATSTINVFETDPGFAHRLVLKRP